jgi:hypothetical protein
MTKDGLSVDVILAKISTSRCAFDTSVAGLHALKQQNVPDAVTIAMMKAAGTSPSASSGPTTTVGSAAAATTIVRQAKVKCMSVSEVPLLAEPEDRQALKQVRCGTDIGVISEQDQWVRIRTLDGTEGYLASIFVSKAAIPTTIETKTPAISSGGPAPAYIRSVAWRAVPWATTSSYQTQASSSTDCLGSGSWVGNTWLGNASCTTSYTPAQSVPISWQHLTVYNLMELGNAEMVIACTRNWAFSKCTYLNPGNFFHYEIKNGKIEIFAQKVGSKKEETLSFDILSSQRK